jgi:hypothetical protein
MVGRDRRLVVDGVGVVAEKLAGRKRELAQPRVGRARFHAGKKRRLEQVEDGSKGLPDIVGLLNEPLGARVALAELA